MVSASRNKTLTEKQCLGYIEKLTADCQRFGWTIEYDTKPGVRKRGLADSETKKITLNVAQRPEHMYYIFIHEIGHMVSRLWHYDWDKRFAILSDSSKKNTAIYRIARIQDEIEAWDIGFQFAKARGFKVNQTKYDKLRVECLTSYMIWATKRKVNEQHHNEQRFAKEQINSWIDT